MLNHCAMILFVVGFSLQAVFFFNNLEKTTLKTGATDGGPREIAGG